ncbi:MAG: hypothetical protein HY315_06950 [Acidobacteria bacterium]|nr:hypothetical protein [Acidobacteriota bacterium]
MVSFLRHFDYRFLLPLIARIPVPAAYRLAEWRGSWAYLIGRESRRHAIRNILQAFPSLSEVEAKAIARRQYQTLSVGEMESCWFERDGAFFRRNVAIAGLEALAEAAGRPGGVILMIGHWGSPGTLIVALARRGIQFHLVVRPIVRNEDPLHPAHLEFATGRLAAIEDAIRHPILYTGRGNFSRMAEFLRSGKIVMLQIDVTPNILRHVQPIQFFGRCAYFGDGIAQLHLQTGARIFHASITRSSGSPRQRILIREIETPPGKQANDLLQRLAWRLEEEIRERPCHWTLWDSMGWFYQPPARNGTQIGKHSENE